MAADDKVNILLVDDQPGKLLSYEVILGELDERLLRANSAQEAFEHLLKADIAVVLVDVCMPDLDGFELARMIRGHPRFQQTAIIFISAVLLTDLDFLRGYECGAVDYVSVPVVPEILRAKVKVFAELYRKTQQLERLNQELEQRVLERTAELEASAAKLRRNEERLRLAFDAAQMGWWDYDVAADRITWSPSLIGIMGFSPQHFGASLKGVLDHIYPEDRDRFVSLLQRETVDGGAQTCELRFVRPDGTVRWALAAGQMIHDGERQPIHFAGIDLDITARKQAEERQSTLVRELDHRAKNLLAVVQSVLHLSHADTTKEFIDAVDGRIRALSRAHTLLSETRWQSVDLGRIVEEELAPFSTGSDSHVVAFGPSIALTPPTAQSLALALHELVTNAVKYGGLSVPEGRVRLLWQLGPDDLVIRWTETGGPPACTPTRQGFGTKVITAGVERQLSGRVVFDWRSEGLDCTLTVPCSNLDMPRMLGKARPIEQMDAEPAQTPVGGRRILLVEDEALIAMMMKETLGGSDITVVGPISTLAQALTAATEDRIDCAILDVNLGGEPTYPVADALAARGIPFVFVTGYSMDSIDRRYAHVPTIEKPIEPQTLRSLIGDGAADPGTFRIAGQGPAPPDKMPPAVALP